MGMTKNLFHNYTERMIFTLLAVLPLQYAEKLQLDDIEESEFRGNIELTAAETFDIESIFLDRRTRGRGNKKNPEKKLRRQKTKKSKHILKMLKFAVPDIKSKDWVAYGCHCFSDIKTDLLTPGTGRAIDKIDSACKALIDCLNCSAEDHGLSKKCNQYVGYSYESYVNEETGANELMCTDDHDTCKRSMCECDARFIKTVQKYNYEVEHSKNKLDKIRSCPKQNNRTGGKLTSNLIGGGRSGGDEVKVCCGPPGLRHPITVTMTRDCCNTKTYNPFLSECCSDGTIESVGSC